MVSEKIPILKISASPGTWPSKSMSIISLEYTLDSHKKKLFVHNPFNVCSNYNYTSEKYSGQEYKKHNLQLNISDTPVTLKQSQGHQTYEKM